MLDYYRCTACGLVAKTGSIALQAPSGETVGHAHLVCSACGTCHSVARDADSRFQIHGQSGPAIAESESRLLTCFEQEWNGTETVADLAEVLRIGTCCCCGERGRLIADIAELDGTCPRCGGDALRHQSSIMF